MTELRDDLDRALRSVTIGEAPVQRAMRDGRRLRNRRRLAGAACAVAVVAVAANYPALTRNAATAPPVTGRTGPSAPSPTAPGGRDPVVTDGPPAAGASAGLIAQGTVGGATWSVAISSGTGPRAQTCYSAYVGSGGSGLAARPADEVTTACAPDMEALVSYAAPGPVGFTAGTGSVSGATTTYAAALGAVAPDVTYLIVDFADGQQLKLIPVSYRGHRYVAWLSPASMTIARLTAHLGSAHADSGQILTAIPYDAPGGLPMIGLWLKPGQSAPPRASGVVGRGTQDGQAWSVTAYEGPWGTCFTFSQGGMECDPTARLGTTQIIGISSRGANPAPAATAFGSAAPGVARLRIALSDGTVVEVTPVPVGNERLFAFWASKGISAAGWTAFDAQGHQIASHAMKPLGDG